MITRYFKHIGFLHLATAIDADEVTDLLFDGYEEISRQEYLTLSAQWPAN